MHSKTDASANYMSDSNIGTKMLGWLKNKMRKLRNLNWQQVLNVNQYDVLGLDIGSSTVRIIQLRKNDKGYAVIAAGMVEIAKEADGMSYDMEANTTKAIRKCFESTGTNTKLAVCGVCGPEVAVRAFRFPDLHSEEMEGAVLLEASQVCPFNIEDGAVDYQVIPDGKEDTTGVLVAATNAIIKNKRELVKNASLDTVLLDVDGLALLNCFGECEKPKPGHTTAILNVGSTFTNLAIIGDNSLPFIRDLPYAGDNIIRDMANENKVSMETISRILSGCEGQSRTELELDKSLERACKKLITDVTETLRFYTAQEKSAVIEKIHVCGGFALVKGFLELLDNQLPATVVLWNPFEKIACNAGPSCRDILQKSGPEMAVAAGLAMRSV